MSLNNVLPPKKNLNKWVKTVKNGQLLSFINELMRNKLVVKT